MTLTGNYLPSQTDIEIMLQRSKKLYIKVELLENDKIIDSLHGNVISHSLNISSDSNARRSFDVSLHVTDSTFSIDRDKKVWFDKQVRPYIGVEHQRSGEIIWYLQGTFIISESSESFSATESTLNLSLQDQMYLLTPEFGGQISEYKAVIPAGEDVRTTIIGLLDSAGITKYNIGLITEEIPYDLEFTAGVGYYEIFSKIAEIYPGWEFYFDIDGTFVWNLIPTCYEDDTVLDSAIVRELIDSSQTSTKHSEIYNKTIVWGQLLEPDFYSENVSLSGNTYIATVQMMTSYENFDTVALRIPTSNPNISYININGLGKVRINDDSGVAIPANEFEGGTSYIFRYRRLNINKESDFYFLGQYQVRGEYTETDNTCQFSVDNVGKVLEQTLTFNEIYSNNLANQRAEYETYLKCRMQDTISVQMIAIYWLEVNQKIEYPINAGDEVIQCIVKDISHSSLGMMEVTLTRFYEDYSVVYNKKYRKY